MTDRTRVPFGELTPQEQQAIRVALENQSLEVNCSWWCEAHWEPKLVGPLWDEAFYRIGQPRNK